ncbi:unnamed protein product [Owenia fusiformis]|uniref:Uncharacterized protein n=1 Tax=Owenia fusiformis TaxID=6347 RepID=A0A8J1UCA6_OWEFU|nr:unnamed protein product [Owenia fusiformis]
MTIERGLGSTSPIHVHVDEVTPVHVHVKKPKKSSTAKAVEERLTRSRLRSAQSFGNGNLRSTARRSTATAQSRSKSPAGGPWVPAPGKTSRNQVSWQGPSHRLEISGPQDDMIHSTLRRSELSTDEEDRVQGHMRGYEKKIDSLMTEVGTLKNEVDLQRTLRDIERKDEALHDTRAALEDQEHEIIDYRRELEATDGENRVLRHSLSRLKDEVSASKGTASALASDRDQLMKVLVEAEMDGQAASKQVSALRDSVRRLREEKRMSSTDTAMLAKQKELLMARLEDFENTNRTLRRLLREQHKQEASGLRLVEQRDVLLKKLAETEDDNQRLRIDVIERDRLLNEVRLQATAQRDENLALSGVQSSLEQTRGHLQKQLRTKEADCNRMAVQIRGLESQLAQEKIEVDHLQELLEAAKEKAERDKDALKKATRVQKQRAARSQDAVEQMNTQLLERETILAQLEDDLHVNRARTEKVAKEKSQVLAENSALKNSYVTTISDDILL